MRLAHHSCSQQGYGSVSCVANVCDWHTKEVLHSKKRDSGAAVCPAEGGWRERLAAFQSPAVERTCITTIEMNLIFADKLLGLVLHAVREKASLLFAVCLHCTLFKPLEAVATAVQVVVNCATWNT